MVCKRYQDGQRNINLKSYILTLIFLIMESLLKKLREQNIIISLENNDLKVKFNGSGLPAELIQELKENKAKIVQYLSEIQNSDKDRQIRPIANQESYPLSSSQYRMWVLSQFEGASRAYNMPGAYILEGRLETAALENALRVLIARHEILRTSFNDDGRGEVRQFILPVEQINFQLSYRDLRTEEDPDDILEEEVRSAMLRPFRLSAAPLLRASIFQVADQRYVFTCVMHHIISDGWSLDILFNELLTCYNAILRGSAIPLKPLRIQYKDYAFWQEQQWNNPVFQAHRSYWLKQLEGPLPVLPLPEDYQRPAEKRYNGGRVSRRLDSDLSREIKAACKRQEASVFMGLIL